MNEWIVQGIGFLGVAFFALSYQVKSNRKLFLCQAIGSGLFALQFFLLGAVSGAYSLLLNIFRGLLLMRYNDWPWVRWKGLAALFCGLHGLITYLTWAGPISLLSFTAAAVSTLGQWQNNAKTIRLANLFCASPCWLAYDILVHSWGGILRESIAIFSVLLSVFRFGWSALGDPDSDFQK